MLVPAHPSPRRVGVDKVRLRLGARRPLRLGPGHTPVCSAFSARRSMGAALGAC